MSFFKNTQKQNITLNEKDQQLTNNLNKNIEMIYEYLCQTEDLMLKKMIFNEMNCTILFLDSIVNKDILQSSVIDPILENKSGDIQYVVKTTELKYSSNISEVGASLLEGYCTILIENDDIAKSVVIGEIAARSIEEPANERSIQSSHDGFVESLSTNILLLRRRIKSPQLKVKFFTLGKITNTKVSMLFIDKLANKKILEEVERRITFIDVDHLLSIGDIEEFIEDNPYSPFPQMLSTERPDRGASYLTEGKIILIVDGSPKVLIVPITFFAFYQSPDDYNSRWVLGSFFRIIRFFSFIISISLPAIYIAIISFHSEILPIGILYSVRVSLEYVPFSPLVEGIVMQIILELLKEASIRLPTPIAQTLGIVGGLIIGTAVVEANLVSNSMIVVIGLTAISSFVAPVNQMGTSARLLGFPVMIAASLFGFFGIVLVLMVLVMHLCKLESFGTHYFSPLAPFKLKDLKDTFVRLPTWKLKTRPTDSQPVYKQQQRHTRGWKNSDY